MAKWLELMRPGTFKDRHGKERVITKDTLDKIATGYKPSSAAITVGHPDKASVPSFGLIEKLKMIGEKLMFLPGKVVPEFAALVRKGRFPDVSAGLNNAMDTLTHVAFLSAQAPAIDGLTPVTEFSAAESDTDAIDITEIMGPQLPEFSIPRSVNWLGWQINNLGLIMRNLKNNAIAVYGQEKADKLFPEYIITEFTNPVPDDPVQVEAAFSSSEVPGQSDVSNDELTRLKTENAEMVIKLAEFSAAVDTHKTELDQKDALIATQNEQLNKYKKEVRASEFSAFVETLITEGRVLPDQKAATIAMMEQIHTLTPAEFSESGSKSPLELYKEELKLRPVILPSGELNMPEFGSTSYDPVAVGNRARDYIDEMRAKGVTVSPIDAVNHVRGLKS